MTGAVCLAAEAAFRADAGYVAVAVPEQSLPVVEANLLEPVKRTWADALDAAEKATCARDRPRARPRGRCKGASRRADWRPASRRSCSTPTHCTSSSRELGADGRC